LRPGSFKWDTSAPVNADLLTRRYLVSIKVVTLHTQAAILANFGVLSNETYLLLLLELNPALAWYQDDSLLNNIKLTGRGLTLKTLLEYGLSDPNQNWSLVTLLRTIFPSPAALKRINQNRIMAMTPEVHKNLFSFVYRQPDQINLLLALALTLDLKTLVRAIMIPSPGVTDPGYLINSKIPLLITLALRVHHNVARETNVVDLTVELADLVITGADLTAVVVSGYAPNQISAVADLLPWYWADIGAVTSLINFINWYLNKVDGDDVINPVVFLIGGYYGFKWPAGVFWNSFSSAALASYCFRKFYNKIDLSSFYQVLNDGESFGGIEIEVLRRRYNLVEI
jgi:hypothetical protein